MILASVGVFLPILLLTYMQYQSLAELEQKTKGAFKDNLRQGFTILQRQMKQRLQDFATQTLEPSSGLQLSSLAARSGAEEIEKHFANVKRSHPEIEEIFLFPNWGSEQQTNSYAYLYSDKFAKLTQAELTPAHSHILATFNRARTAQSFLSDKRNYLFAHDSCPACPPNMREGAYLFFPLPDQIQQSGFAGVLLNERFVRDDLLAGTISKLAAAHSPEIAITISDDTGRVLYSNAGAQDGYLVESNFDRPFSSWRAGIGLKNTNLDSLARNSFLHSAGATVLASQNRISFLVSRSLRFEAMLRQLSLPTPT